MGMEERDRTIKANVHLSIVVKDSAVSHIRTPTGNYTNLLGMSWARVVLDMSLDIRFYFESEYSANQASSYIKVPLLLSGIHSPISGNKKGNLRFFLFLFSSSLHLTL